MNYGITGQQSRLLQYIAKHSTEQGFCPSYRQMMDAVGIHSTSGVSRLIAALEERGLIRRMPNRKRAIELLKPVKVDVEIAAAELKTSLAHYSTQELRRELVRRQEGAAA